MIDLAACIEQMHTQAHAIAQLVTGLSHEQARWKPTPETWSILEVVNHLYDEEREDFRTRVRHVLDQAEGLPPNIDPQGWVTARRYNERDLAESLAAWLRERAASLEWLRALDAPDWNAALEAPFGRIRAGDLMMAWVAHDLLHLRQVVELRYAYLNQQAMPYSTRYAGEW